MADDVAASTTYPMAAGMVKVGHCIVMTGRPCKILGVNYTKTGKHGQAKVHITACDIFTSMKHDAAYPQTDNVDVVNGEHKQYQLLDITDNGSLSLKSVDGSIRDDLKVGEGVNGEVVGKNIEQLFGVDKEGIYVETLSAIVGLEAACRRRI